MKREGLGEGMGMRMLADRALRRKGLKTSSYAAQSD
jgi:hypothetical protein